MLLLHHLFSVDRVVVLWLGSSIFFIRYRIHHITIANSYNTRLSTNLIRLWVEIKKCIYVSCVHVHTHKVCLYASVALHEKNNIAQSIKISLIIIGMYIRLSHYFYQTVRHAGSCQASKNASFSTQVDLCCVYVYDTRTYNNI